ncbi:MAG TPA: phosphoglucosamine mutase [Polyangiaceae bacterium LLY-WYZ-15_(1-7)]|nr:phosphoglucosamine mutase [Sandaracinus sp.]HJK94630.1 phosphoglucosamine mutase [Polyangiaceae bacterium LLY-WYZ-15_(1-7)]HJL03972.1 phosphoglucosamine mutase [Polyangiaceae bacterium LLY-WYZ-15_(1-7)]HJL13822.1 phosphoglucosamine mutase [Polyangiaceae bacterium LLY-WYZ-15_(1-7)]HJL22154.1 phosphoglucosamine mutase [Polyangiaceae bacterium LLY-WYZ-15_(1-7)]
MSRKYFGTDGIRGLANAGAMTPEMAFRIGLAVTYQAKQTASHAPRVVIGKDTRLSGYLFETALASGVCAMGGRVLLSGPLPTPAIAHLTTSMRADVGVVISASHNAYQDNGIKLFGADGFKLPDVSEEALEALIDGDELDEKRPTGTRIGRAERLDDAPGRYVAFVKATFPSDRTLDGVKIVVDAAHGAAYRTAPLVFSELGADVHAIGVKPDGKNINKRVGALHPEACAREVKKRKAHMGLALDGDADRVIVLDEKGQVIDGDVVMALCATHMLRARKLRKKTLVATVMSNLGLEHAMQRAGGKLRRCAVGDRYVVETLKKHGLSFGGEQSGHLIFLDHATTGDGLVAALQVLAIVTAEQRPLSEIAAEVMERVPQVLVNGRFDDRKPLKLMGHTKKAIAAVEEKLGADGRVLVRWSGTEPKLRVMVEGPDEKKIDAMARQILSAAEKDMK